MLLKQSNKNSHAYPFPPPPPQLPHASLIFASGGNSILLNKLADHNFWFLPGGHAALLETSHQTLRREELGFVQRQRLGLEVNAFATYITLEPVLSTVTAQQATDIDTAFARYPDYQWNEQQQKKLRAEFYRILLPMVGAAKMVETPNSLLRLQRV